MANKKMLVKKGVRVVRDGRRVRPEIGKNFQFTADEIDQINRVTPGTLVAPVEAEDGEAAVAASSKSGSKAAGTVKAGSNAEAAQAGAKGGKKKATANKADGEGSNEDASDEDEEL